MATAGRAFRAAAILRGSGRHLGSERHVTTTLIRKRVELIYDLIPRFPRIQLEGFEGRAIVFYKGDRMGEARPVDFLGNDRKPPRPKGLA